MPYGGLRRPWIATQSSCWCDSLFLSLISFFSNTDRLSFPSLQILMLVDNSWPALQSQSVSIIISLTGALIKGQEIVFVYQLRLVSWFVFCICDSFCLYSGYSNEDLSVTWIQHLILCNIFRPQYYTFFIYFFLQWTREKKGFNYSFTINLWN